MTRAARTAAAAAFVLFAAGGVLLTAAPASADTSDFTVTSFSADYYLDVDDAGRSRLKTVETIVAQFPDYDQNHGILRDLISDYDSHPTDLQISSVTDGDGNRLSYDTEDDDNVLELKIGDEDRYVHGTQTYVITYTEHNVTGSFSNTNDDEFYWDTNGVNWDQSFGLVTARVHVAKGLVDALTGDAACYRGYDGSNTPCDSEATADDEDGGVVYTATAAGLSANQNLTVSVGFDKGTFVPRSTSAWASPYFYLELLLVAIAVLTGIFMLVRRTTVFADAPGRPTIVAEYIEPKGVSALMAGIVTKRKKRAVAAQLISFAVHHNIRIIEAPATGFFSSGPDYIIELVTLDGLGGEELELAQMFFGYTAAPGTQYRMKKSDTTLGQRVYKLIHDLDGATVSRGFHKEIPLGARFFPTVLGVGSAIVAFIMVVLLLDDARGGWLPALVFVPAAIAAFIVLGVVARRPYTAKGAELRDYLKGLLLYIQVAETDRIRILQSPEGAERTPVDTTDRGEMLKLYERVLPFAVLFDEEKRWAKELGDYYDQQPPDWYSGTSAFNTLAFAAGINSVSSLSSSSFSGSSSSSGGSGGGGSSGGGGGGGGGGGW